MKHTLLLFEGGMLFLHNMAALKLAGALWLKIFSGAALVGWIIFSMMHMVIGVGVLF